jgi:hypothetical protein
VTTNPTPLDDPALLGRIHEEYKKRVGTPPAAIRCSMATYSRFRFLLQSREGDGDDYPLPLIIDNDMPDGEFLFEPAE